MQCTGRNVFTNEPIEVAGDAAITRVAPAASAANYLAPGFVDIQVNGYGGVDYGDPKADLALIARSLEMLFATGVTRFFPTVITGSRDSMLGALANLAKARKTLPRGRAIAGIHVEGPHISPKDGPRGAHPSFAVRPPSTDEFDRWQEAAEGAIRLVTLSPEWPETPAYIRHVTARGVTASIGHLDATEEQIQAAVDAGATFSTHLGNGANKTLPRHPNYLWQQLAEDRLSAGFIVDGIHLGRDFLNVALRAKGLDRAVLVTDAAMPAGCAPGPYMLGEVEVTLHPYAPGECGRVTLRDGDRLAGSALSMDRGVENLMRLAGLTLAQAVKLSTLNPARVGQLANRQKGFAVGDATDVVELSYDDAKKAIRVLHTWLDGELVYSA